MTYHSPFLADAPARSPAPVAVLRCRDEFNMDPVPLKALFAALPDHEAEDIVCRALEDIASRLNALQAARCVGAFANIATPAKRVAAVADQIGLTEISLVAGHTAKASAMECGVALGATMARLERVFDAAVNQIWDFRHYG
jgi:hypothetical protein